MPKHKFTKPIDELPMKCFMCRKPIEDNGNWFCDECEDKPKKVHRLTPYFAVDE